MPTLSAIQQAKKTKWRSLRCLRRQLKASGNLHPGRRRFHPSRSSGLSSTDYAICPNEVSIKVYKVLLGTDVLNHRSLLVGTSKIAPNHGNATGFFQNKPRSNSCFEKNPGQRERFGRFEYHRLSIPKETSWCRALGHQPERCIGKMAGLRKRLRSNDAKPIQHHWGQVLQ